MYLLCWYFRGQAPSAAEYHYLDKVKWLDMYGVDLHPVVVSINAIQRKMLAWYVKKALVLLTCINICFNNFNSRPLQKGTVGLTKKMPVKFWAILLFSKVLLLSVYLSEISGLAKQGVLQEDWQLSCCTRWTKDAVWMTKK